MRSWRGSTVGLLVVSITAGVACSSAAKPVSVSRPAVDEIPTGAVAIVFTRPAKGVTVALDGRLVVDRAHTDSVMIENVTAGMTEVMIAAGSGPSRVERQLRVEVDVGQVTTIPLGAPQGSSSPSWANAALSVAALVISTAVTSWLF